MPTGPSSRGAAESGPKLTVFAYGQTGSGKTYTMEAVSNAAIGRLLAWTAAPQLQPAPVYLVMTLFEIYGEKCYVSPTTVLNKLAPCNAVQGCANGVRLDQSEQSVEARVCAKCSSLKQLTTDDACTGSARAA